jgi:hypothetical protein
MRKFRVIVEAEFEIEVADPVIDAVDDEWREQLYDLDGVEEIVGHVALNMAVNNAKLSELEGWADQPDDNAKVTSRIEWSTPYVKEITI